MIFTENPWPGVILFLFIGLIFLGRAIQTGRVRSWAFAVVMLGLSAASYFVELAIVTPAEEVEQRVHEVVQACIDADTEKVLNMISARQVTIRTVAVTGLNMADIHENMHVSDLSVEMTAQGSRAISHFRANGTVSVGAHEGHASTRWEVTWQKENDEWKIVDVTRLDPITGKEMNILNAGQR